MGVVLALQRLFTRPILQLIANYAVVVASFLVETYIDIEWLLGLARILKTLK